MNTINIKKLDLTNKEQNREVCQQIDEMLEYCEMIGQPLNDLLDVVQNDEIIYNIKGLEATTDELDNALYNVQALLTYIREKLNTEPKELTKNIKRNAGVK